MMQTALSDDFRYPDFRIAYQPILNVSARRVSAYEALVRGARGESYPQLTAKMNVEEGRAFQRAAADKAIRRSLELGLLDRPGRLSVNLSPDLAPDAMTAEFVCEVARAAGMPADRLVVELTEDHKLTPAQLRVLLDRSRKAGFATAMDDFGAGYSGLTALVECRPDVLKLDRLLVKDIDQNDVRQKIVGAFARVCKALDMRLVAEGVETAAECKMLRQLGIRYMQGYLFCKPMLDMLPRLEDCNPSAWMTVAKSTSVRERSGIWMSAACALTCSLAE